MIDKFRSVDDVGRWLVNNSPEKVGRKVWKGNAEYYIYRLKVGNGNDPNDLSRSDDKIYRSIVSIARGNGMELNLDRYKKYIKLFNILHGNR